MATAMASSRLTLCSTSPSISSTKKKGSKNGESSREAPSEFARVLKCDREFIGKRLQSTGEKTQPLRDRISRTIGDFFWLRHIEDPTAVEEPLVRPSLPPISYPPGLYFFLFMDSRVFFRVLEKLRADCKKIVPFCLYTPQMHLV